MLDTVKSENFTFNLHPNIWPSADAAKRRWSEMIDSKTCRS